MKARPFLSDAVETSDPTTSTYLRDMDVAGMRFRLWQPTIEDTSLCSYENGQRFRGAEAMTSQEA